jgi:putative phage-type endonuclease
MKIYNVKQGTKAWHDLRAGTITASDIQSIFAKPRKGDKSIFGKGAQTYIAKKVCERIRGVVELREPNEAMQWGLDHEQGAREAYGKVYGKNVVEVGFIEKEAGIGCSPDGLIDENSMLEIKCPFSQDVWNGYMAKNEAPRNYLLQMLHQLWVADRDFVVFFALSPCLEKHLMKVYTIDSLLELTKIASIEEYEERVMLVASIIDIGARAHVEVLALGAVDNVFGETEYDDDEENYFL